MAVKRGFDIVAVPEFRVPLAGMATKLAMKPIDEMTPSD